VRDLNDILDLNLELPVGGKTYVVKPPPADVGAHLMNRLALGIALDAGIDLPEEDRRATVVDDDEMPDFGRQCLGLVLDEMTADGLSGAQIEFCITTAFYAWTVGKAFAEIHWETAGNLVRPVEERPGRPTATQTHAAAASSSPTSASPSGTKTTPPAPTA
jgi:hypothetical protein